ncbi:hypothetical protein [Paraburkholderia sp. JPY419]|uniref:hypothetical protein n=1 Tax=Paraburkholderia sp. JPY419 TaxID=667660 RepID=UPI003D229B31
MIMVLEFKLVVTLLLLLAASLAGRRGRATFSIVDGLLQWSALPHAGLFLVAILAVRPALNLIPNKPATTDRLDPPWWNMPSRMALIAGLVVSVTLVARYVGSKTSGVIASFPFMVIMLAIFSHRMTGRSAAQQVLRGMWRHCRGLRRFSMPTPGDGDLVGGDSYSADRERHRFSPCGLCHMASAPRASCTKFNC